MMLSAKQWCHHRSHCNHLLCPPALVATLAMQQGHSSLCPRLSLHSLLVMELLGLGGPQLLELRLLLRSTMNSFPGHTIEETQRVALCGSSIHQGLRRMRLPHPCHDEFLQLGATMVIVPCAAAEATYSGQDCSQPQSQLSSSCQLCHLHALHSSSSGLGRP